MICLFSDYQVGFVRSQSCDDISVSRVNGDRRYLAADASWNVASYIVAIQQILKLEVSVSYTS
jgi:hypothetical protein